MSHRTRLVVLAALVLAACAKPAAHVPSWAELVGSEWILESIGGQKALAKPAATLSFDGAKISGTGSCNQFAGTSELAVDGALHVGPLLSSRKACAPPVMEQEARYFQALQAAERLTGDAAHLAIYSHGEAEPLRFRRK